jgi:DNA/RNA endonuclease G (NUC1)
MIGTFIKHFFVFSLTFFCSLTYALEPLQNSSEEDPLHLKLPPLKRKFSQASILDRDDRPFKKITNPSMTNCNPVHHVPLHLLKNLAFSYIVHKLGTPIFQKKSSKDNVLTFSSKDIFPLVNPHYIAFFNKETKGGYLSIHSLTKGPRPRIHQKNHHQKFIPDRRLQPKLRLYHEDFQDPQSLYSRGHLTPNGDMQNPRDKKQTFLLSNVVPQIQKGFNDTLWNRVELCGRYLSQQTHQMIAYTGVIFDERASYVNGAKRSPVIPQYFYKVFLLINKKYSTFKTLVYLIENRSYKGENQDLSRFIISLQELEDISGIHFFPHLDRKLLQNANDELSALCL